MTNDSPQINFYILSQDRKEAFSYLVPLIEKIYSEKTPCFIYTDSLGDSKQLNDYLWTYQEASFLPHHIVDECPYPAPILISHQKAPPNPHILINLNPEIPPFYRQFKEIIELVFSAEADKKEGRKKYKRYQANGYNIVTHKSTIDA